MEISNQRRPGGLTKFRVTDREECGVIVENDEHLLYILKVPNHAHGENDYVILKTDVEKVREVLSPDEKIVGFFHTHLPHHECEPTDDDFHGAELNPTMQHLIYKPSTKEICWYGGVLAEVAIET